jgi:hypothetical protein
MVQAPPTRTLPLFLQPPETANTANRRPKPVMKRWRVDLLLEEFIAVLFQQEARQPMKNPWRDRAVI